MQKEVQKIIMKKIDESRGDINKLQRSLSEYFDVPLEDIQTNIRMSIPVKEDIIKNDVNNVNLTLKVDKAEYIDDSFDEDTETYDIYEEEKKEAKEEGMFEGKLEVARNLFESGTMSFEEISKITGLSFDDLNSM